MSENNENVGTPGYSVGVVNAKNAEDEAATVAFDFGATLEETVEKFGEAVVHYHACKKFATSLRNKLYTLITAGDEPMSIEAAQAELASWVPTVSAGRAKKSPMDAAIASLDKMTPEQRTEFIEILKAQAAA